jgi:hypothetical protein
MKAEIFEVKRDQYKWIRLAVQRVISKNVEELKQPIELIIRNKKPAAEKRRDVQNSLMWHWNGEEANFHNKRGSHLGKEFIPKVIHLYNKLDYGVPIMCRDVDFMAMWDQFKFHSRPAQIGMMKYIPVTRFMNVEQMTEYLTTLRQDKEENGIILTDSEDMEKEALGYGKRIK